ncbi:DUF2523 domain-containing protein [Xanthomonas citri pv. citri]|uniref:DUF2523 domain-containing protein n=2 Tax=Pseudomonadota TaxID=1224 RepID=A0A0U5FCT2_XANCI|nr:DUF2523 family protein [Xanthomonas citri]APR11032.1 hypothetical protein BI314_13495 [Xanthomonas citri pv. citri]APR20275.1 hypothetical protein BI316_12795 [Xanthomonas citri pv. citri]ARR17808.1 hypothetical protein B7L65_13480 [Xanthomonas citri pv. citri]ARR23708.1 hypothetical protein B7L67_20920 [Xanthomonas citri pv. citri]ARR23726.1 hypothetical protein B7L67_21025 [Xanthomonas citri pv. citri]
MFGPVWDWIRRGVGLLWEVFFSGIGRIVSKITASFGVTLVSVNALLPNLKTFITTYVGALPDWAQNFLGAVGFDIFITMIISALSVRFMFKVIPMPTSVAQQLGAVKQ